MRPTEVHQFPQHHSDKMRGTGLGWFGGFVLLILALMAFSLMLDLTIRKVGPVVADTAVQAMHAIDAATLAGIHRR